MLLSKVWEMYESDKRIEGFSPQTLKAYKLQAILLIRYFKDIKLDTITTVQLKEYLAKASQALKPSSLAHRIRFIKSLFRWSHEEGHISKNSASKIKEPKQVNAYPSFLQNLKLNFYVKRASAHWKRLCLNSCFPLDVVLAKLFR